MFLDHLRSVSMACRVKPRADLFEACALLTLDRTVSREALAEALVRSLDEALGKPARFHAPGTSELTFDEHWLMRLGMTLAAEDEDSQRFLLASRVGFDNRRHVRFLMSGLADSFLKLE